MKTWFSTQLINNNKKNTRLFFASLREGLPWVISLIIKLLKENEFFAIFDSSCEISGFSYYLIVGLFSFY